MGLFGRNRRYRTGGGHGRLYLCPLPEQGNGGLILRRPGGLFYPRPYGIDPPLSIQQQGWAGRHFTRAFLANGRLWHPVLDYHLPVVLPGAPRGTGGSRPDRWRWTYRYLLPDYAAIG